MDSLNCQWGYRISRRIPCIPTFQTFQLRNKIYRKASSDMAFDRAYSNTNLLLLCSCLNRLSLTSLPDIYPHGPHV
jgi:hypothetical protein